MKEIKNFIWVLIFIGGILALVAIFTPVVYYLEPYGEYYGWIWGLWYDAGGMSSAEFYFDAYTAPIHRLIPIYIIRLIPTILIFLSSILLIIMANRLRAGRRHLKDVENKIIVWGVILILAPIIFTISYNLFSLSYDLFMTDLPGFAFIAPIIGGALALVDGIFSKYKISGENSEDK